jgi:hypothetical protein
MSSVATVMLVDMVGEADHVDKHRTWSPVGRSREAVLQLWVGVA